MKLFRLLILVLAFAVNGFSAVTYQSISSIATGTDDSAEATAPSGVVSGDLLILMVRSASSTDPGTPDGWNLISNITNWFSAHDSAIYWRIADGGANDTPTVTIGTGEWYAIMIRADGHDGTTPIDDFWTNTGANEGDPYTFNDLTVSADGSLCVLGSLSHFGGGSSAPDLSGSGYDTVRASQVDASATIGVYTGAFDASTDCGASVDFGGSIRAGNFVIAIAPGAGGGGGEATSGARLRRVIAIH